ncbi:MAG: ComF family protein [Ignavibacteriales bacterium]|nr:MAG: ComF family protein [Ignavibacteriales bacterium]
MLKAVTAFGDFFLPRFCSSCNGKLQPAETVVCPACLSKIKFAEDERIRSEFKRKFASNNIITDFISLYVFEKDKELQHIIHSLKYSNRFLTGKFLGSVLSVHLKKVISGWKIDVLIPVPLHQLKKAERGYNQSFYIAKGLGNSLKIPVSERFIRRKKYTQSQTTMTLKERQENIEGAFKAKRKLNLDGKNILLLDDVITTGSTILECGKVLLKAGANKVYAVSVAIAD